MEYTRLLEEGDRVKAFRPPEDWPSRGDITLNNVSLTYPNSDQAVLKNVSVHIESGSKIGVVGRTGAGKSSLLTALLRMYETSLANGIIIDGIETNSIGLDDLEPKICIIPQDPILFPPVPSVATWTSTSGTRMSILGCT